VTPQQLTLSLRIERKQDDLPRYVVVPSKAIAAWKLAGTTVLEVSLDGSPSDRRTIKPWGDDTKWFLTITEVDCRRLGVDTGSSVSVGMIPASNDLPAELARLLKADRAARAAWDRLTRAQQRMLREVIGAAKQSATRERRARRVLLGA
jgi:hypothetical protein